MDEQPITTNKIYGAIAAIMRDTKAITKSSRNQQQGFMFRGIDAVMNELHDLFANNGVFILPEVLDYNVAEKVTGKGTILYYTRAKIKFHFVADDASEVCTINVGEAMDSGDKGMNKAMSIALKYALMQMLLIRQNVCVYFDIVGRKYTPTGGTEKIINDIRPYKIELYGRTATQPTAQASAPQVAAPAQTAGYASPAPATQPQQPAQQAQASFPGFNPPI